MLLMLMMLVSREAQKSSLDEKPNFQFGRIPTNTQEKLDPPYLPQLQLPFCVRFKNKNRPNLLYSLLLLSYSSRARRSSTSSLREIVHPACRK